MIRIVIVSLLLSAPFAAPAQMYKWVDEKGVTHYSESPPPDGKGAKIEVKPATGNPPAPPPSDWKQKELDARQQRIQKEQQEKQSEAQEENQAATRRGRCIESRRQLEIVQRARPVYQMNEKGEKVYLEDAQREREVAGWQANVKKYCD